MSLKPSHDTTRNWQNLPPKPYSHRRKRGGPLILFLLFLVLFGCALFFYPNILSFLAGKQKGEASTSGSLSVNTALNLSGYQTTTVGESTLHQGNLVLVNGTHSIKEPQGQTVRIYDHKTASYSVKDKTVFVHEDTMEPLNQLLDGFYATEGKTDILVTSGFRDAEYQRRLYEEAEDKSFVQKPKHSEHETGYAVDLHLYNDKGQGFPYDGTGVYRWINQNCDQYGFILRYAESKKGITGISYEPWHFRYVGIPHATIITENDMAFEEYIDYLRGFPYGEKHLSFTKAGISYEIYFVAATGRSTALPIPSGKEYTVSGNNLDGFIVTTKKK